MKTINLRGIKESLSESEMKKVRGGAKEDPPITPLTVAEAACVGLLPDSPCSMASSGTSVWGICVRYKNAPMKCE